MFTNDEEQQVKSTPIPTPENLAIHFNIPSHDYVNYIWNNLKLHWLQHSLFLTIILLLMINGVRSDLPSSISMESLLSRHMLPCYNHPLGQDHRVPHTDSRNKHVTLLLAPLLWNQISLIHGLSIKLKSLSCQQFRSYSYQILCHVGGTSPPTQNFVTVEAKLWTAEPFLVDPWSMDQADLVW